MFLITYDDMDTRVLEHTDAAQAYEEAEKFALLGYANVRVWLLARSVTLEPRTVWQDHAKGLTAHIASLTVPQGRDA